jgi:hypothetical protein
LDTERSESLTMLLLYPDAFAKGREHYVYRGIFYEPAKDMNEFLEQPKSQMQEFFEASSKDSKTEIVFKINARSAHLDEKDLHQKLEVASTANHFAEAFTMKFLEHTNHSIKVLAPMIVNLDAEKIKFMGPKTPVFISLKKDFGTVIALAEEYLDPSNGPYWKAINNDGRRLVRVNPGLDEMFVRDYVKSYYVLDMFCVYVYVKSDGAVMVTDIQGQLAEKVHEFPVFDPKEGKIKPAERSGHVFRLTDLAIASTNSCMFHTATNMGEFVIEKIFKDAVSNLKQYVPDKWEMLTNAYPKLKKRQAEGETEEPPMKK